MMTKERKKECSINRNFYRNSYELFSWKERNVIINVNTLCQRVHNTWLQA